MAIAQKPLLLRVPCLHGTWGIFPRFVLVMFVTNVVWGQNLPRFAFSIAGVQVRAVAVDSQGSSYLTGTVDSNSFTATAGVLQPQYAGGTCYGGGGIGPPLPIPCHNAFVIKLDPSGAVMFATYLGGASSADGEAIAVDSEGNVYVTGIVGGAGFPVTPGSAFAGSAPGGGFIISWVAKLNASATTLNYATLIPATYIVSIAVDGVGSVYFTGSWDGYGAGLFPATPGAFQTAPLIPATASSIGETIVGKLNPSGSALVYGSYLSGSLGVSSGIAIAVDANGGAIVTGSTGASDFPATGQFIPNSANLYLTKFSTDGSSLIYSTLLGPAGPTAMKTDASGNIYIACEAVGPVFPLTGAGFGVTPPASGENYYLLRVSADGSTVLGTTYLPFLLSGLDVDSVGNVYVSGQTPAVLPFRMSVGAFQPSSGPVSTSHYEGVIAKIAPNGQVAGSTYFGGSLGSTPITLVAEQDGSVVVVGAAPSLDFLGLPSGTSGNFAANIFPAITFENWASFVANTAVPGELASIQGYGIGPAAGVSASPVNTLAGLQVYFDNFAAPIIYAQARQINVQVPWEIAGQSITQVRIMFNGALAGNLAVLVGAALPGIFAIGNSDGSPNSPSNPARTGDFVAIYGTGGGTTNPPGVTGGAWPPVPLSLLTQPALATVGAEAAPVLYQGSAPTLESGFFQINVRLPSSLPSGVQLLSVTIGGVTSVPVAISVQ
jgi:uncharacterized protein (TIGR03437 family)